MRVIIVPMMAMAESSGPRTRSRALAAAMATKGWEVTLCVPEGLPYAVPNSVHTQPILMPSPLGMPRILGKKLFPLAQKLGLNRHVPIACFDDVLKLTGNTDERYLAAAVNQLRKIIRNGQFDAVYSEFNIAAIIAAKAENVPIFGTTSFPTQPSYAENPPTVAGVNHVLRSLLLEPVHTPEDVLLMPTIRFVPSCRALEPFPEDDSVVFTGPFVKFPPKILEAQRNIVIVYLGNGTITPHRARNILAEVLRDSHLDLYIAGLPESHTERIHTALYLDFSRLLPRTAIFVNHGGQNSIMDGIFYGAPQLICPGKVFERRFNARMAEQNDLGISLENNCFNTESVCKAINQLLKNSEEYRKAASVLKDNLLNLGGTNKVLSLMEQHKRF